MGIFVKNILDVCCGGKMFWFNKKNPNVLFCDIRKEKLIFPGNRTTSILPDMIVDFCKMPFSDNTFKLVVFDPPHLIKPGKTGWMFKKYGGLSENWKDDLKKGFEECFRVLKPDGILIFKWNETDIKVEEILKLTPVNPLFGNRQGKKHKTHWICFMKNKQKKEYFNFITGKLNV